MITSRIQTPGSERKSDRRPEVLMGATKLARCPVVDAQGKRLGSIEDVVIDTRTGCARFAVLAIGGIFGFGRRRYEIPWSAISADADSNRCVLDVGILWLSASPEKQDARGPTSSIPTRK
jgi:sporulation protein YlmC with PRC-barrel domain